MAAYLRPYGPEIGAFFANFNAIFNDTGESDSHYWRTFLTGDDANVATPPGVKSGIATHYNSIPQVR